MLLTLASDAILNAIAMATDGNTMYYLVVGPTQSMPPTWVTESDVKAASMAR